MRILFIDFPVKDWVTYHNPGAMTGAKLNKAVVLPRTVPAAS